MSSRVLLRAVVAADPSTLFAQQLDPIANTMVAFITKDLADREVFMAHWARIMGDETITINAPRAC